ncbi:hypothetical protein TNCV_1288951, partial [Trichonephila clavipes]
VASPQSYTCSLYICPVLAVYKKRNSVECVFLTPPLRANPSKG